MLPQALATYRRKAAVSRYCAVHVWTWHMAQVLSVGQKLLVKLKKTLLLTITALEFPDFDSVGGRTGGAASVDRGQYLAGSSALLLEVPLPCAIPAATSVTRPHIPLTKLALLQRAPSARVKLTGGSAAAAKGGARNIFSKSFDFNTMGIGGLDSEFNQIFKRAFASRIFPEHIVEQVRGVATRVSAWGSALA